jgi:hypothetical protein
MRYQSLMTLKVKNRIEMKQTYRREWMEDSPIIVLNKNTPRRIKSFTKSHYKSLKMMEWAILKARYA